MIRSWVRGGAIEVTGQGFVENFIDQAALAGARGHPGHAAEHAKGKGNINVAKVVGACAFDCQPAAGRVPVFGHGNHLTPGQIIPGDGLRAVLEVIHAALRHNAPPMFSGAGPDINNVVGRAQRIFVVFHDNQGVAQVAQAFERAKETCVVLLVQANGGLIQDIQYPDQAGTNLRRKADSLGLTAERRVAAARLKLR